MLYVGFQKANVKHTQLPRNTLTLDEIWDILFQTKWWDNVLETGYFSIDSINKEIEKLGFRPFSESYHRKHVFDWPFRKGCLWNRDHLAWEKQVWKTLSGKTA